MLEWGGCFGDLLNPRVLLWYQMTSVVFSNISCTFSPYTTCWVFSADSSSLHFQTQWAALFCCFISCFLSVLSQSRSLSSSPVLFSFMTLLAGNVLGIKLKALLVCDLSTTFKFCPSSVSNQPSSELNEGSLCLVTSLNSDEMVE